MFHLRSFIHHVCHIPTYPASQHSRSPQPFQRLTIAHSFNQSFDLQAPITGQRNPTYCLDTRILDIASAGLSIFSTAFALGTTYYRKRPANCRLGRYSTCSWNPVYANSCWGSCTRRLHDDGQYRILLTMYWNITNMGKWRSVLREALERPRRLD